MQAIVSVRATLVPFLLAFSIFLGHNLHSVEATSVIRTGETVSLQEEEAVEGNFYAASQKIGISGEVQEDLVVAAGQMTMNGTIGADAFILGGTVDIHGSTGDDLRIIAGEVTIAEPVNGDIFVIAGSVDLLSTASVTGDIIIYGGQATIEGSVGGNVYGYVEELRIDAPVAGGVDIAVTKLTLGDRAMISGDLKYTSNLIVEKSLNATVGGETVRNDIVGQTTSNSTAQLILLPLLVLLFSSLVWYWLSIKSLRAVTGRALALSPRPFLIGVSVLLLTPFVVGLLLFSAVGMFAALALLLAYFLVIMLAIMALPATLGQLLLRSYNKAYSLSYLTLIVGGVGVSALILLNFVGFLVLLALVVISVGAMVDLLIRPEAKLIEEEKRRESK